MERDEARGWRSLRWLPGRGDARALILLALACFCFRLLGYALGALVIGSGPPIALISGIAIAGLLLGGKRLWPAIPAGVLLATPFTSAGDSWLRWAVGACVIAAAALAGVFTIQRLSDDPVRSPRAETMLILGVGCLVSAIILAVATTSALALGGTLPRAAWLGATFTGVLRHGVGGLITLSLVLSWTQARDDRWTAWRVGELLLLLALNAAVTGAVFLTDHPGPLAWAVGPPLIWCALSFRLRGATLALAISVAIVLLGTASGLGPFAAYSIDPMTDLQLFVAVGAGTVLLVGALSHERQSEAGLRRAANLAQAAAEEAEARYRAIFDQAAVGVVRWSPEMRFEAINDRACEILGISRARIADIDWSALLGRRAVAVHARAMAEMLTGARREIGGEARIRRSDGTVIWIAGSIGLVRNARGEPVCFVGMHADITGRKLAEQALQEATARLSLAQSAAGAGSWEIDLESGVTVHTAESARLFDLPITPDLRYTVNHLTDRIDSENAEILRSAVRQAVATGGRAEATGSIRLRDGSERWLRSVGQYNDRGPRPRLLGMTMDVTAIIEAQREAQSAQKRLMALSRLSAVGAMASTLAHELNQPLTAISNYSAVGAHLLAGSPDPAGERLGELFAQLGAESLRAGRIIRRMRDFAVSGEVACEFENLPSIIDSTCSSLREKLIAEDVEIELDLDDAAEDVFVDRTQIEQVITNLVSNGIEATSGRPSRRVSVITRVDGDFARIQVIDNGCGLSPELIANLFEPFRTTKTTGTGLGLALCRTIVEAHGGLLWAEPVASGGAMFTLTVPMHDGSAQTSRY